MMNSSETGCSDDVITHNVQPWSCTIGIHKENLMNTTESLLGNGTFFDS